MKSRLLNILSFLLFISLHIGINSRLPETLFMFYVAAFLFAVVSLTATPHTRIRLNIAFGIILFFVIHGIVQYLWQGNLFGSYRLYTTAILLLLFFLFSAQLQHNRQFAKSTAWVVICTVAVEVVWGIAQSIGLISNSEQLFSIGGSLGNPGAYAGYLAVTSPLLLSFLMAYKKNKKFENIYYVFLALFVLSLYLLLITKSRGAWIATFVGCGSVLLYKYAGSISQLLTSKRVKLSLIVSVVVFTAVGGFFLYKFKENSAFGRLLVWKVTTQTPHKNLLTGNGIGYFETQYGKWQATYFEETGGTEKEQYVADYVTTAYNEFLETALEQGIIAAILLGILFITAIAYGRKNLSTIELGAKASIIAIGVLLLCSYPFNVLPIALYLVFCLSVVFHKRGKNLFIKNRFTHAALSLSLIILIGAITYKGSINAYGFYLLKKGQQQVIMQNNPLAAINTYRKAESLLENNGVFYFYYGSACFLAGEYPQAVEALSVSCRQSSNPNSFVLLGNAHKATDNIEQAEKAYKTAVYMQPSRLYPKYLLVKLYDEAGDNVKARHWAAKILDTEEKVPTTAAKEIKEEMKLVLQSNER